MAAVTGQDHQESDRQAGDPRRELAGGAADQLVALGQDTEVVEHLGFSHGGTASRASDRRSLAHSTPSSVAR